MNSHRRIFPRFNDSFNSSDCIEMPYCIFSILLNFSRLSIRLQSDLQRFWFHLPVDVHCTQPTTKFNLVAVGTTQQKTKVFLGRVISTKRKTRESFPCRQHTFFFFVKLPMRLFWRDSVGTFLLQCSFLFRWKRFHRSIFEYDGESTQRMKYFRKEWSY